MTNLQKFAAQQLSKSQMNSIKGGSASCPPGLHAYNCVLTIGGVGQSEVGHVCAENLAQAHQLADAELERAGLEVSMEFRNVCNPYR